MLLFMAAEKLRVLKDVVRVFLAWMSVRKDVRALNLNALQIEEAETNSAAAEKFAHDEKLIVALGAETLRQQLDKYIWKTVEMFCSTP